MSQDEGEGAERGNRGNSEKHREAQPCGSFREAVEKPTRGEGDHHRGHARKHVAVPEIAPSTFGRYQIRHPRRPRGNGNAQEGGTRRNRREKEGDTGRFRGHPSQQDNGKPKQAPQQGRDRNEGFPRTKTGEYDADWQLQKPDNRRQSSQYSQIQRACAQFEGESGLKGSRGEHAPDRCEKAFGRADA